MKLPQTDIVKLVNICRATLDDRPTKQRSTKSEGKSTALALTPPLSEANTADIRTITAVGQ